MTKRKEHTQGTTRAAKTADPKKRPQSPKTETGTVKGADPKKPANSQKGASKGVKDAVSKKHPNSSKGASRTAGTAKSKTAGTKQQPRINPNDKRTKATKVVTKRERTAGMDTKPEILIDWTTVDQLLEAQCHGTEIADYLGIHVNTLYRKCEEDNSLRFSEYSRIKKSKGQAYIKAKQFKLMADGSERMSIWLGKQYLGQRDKRDVTTDDKPVQGLRSIGEAFWTDVQKADTQDHSSEEE